MDIISEASKNWNGIRVVKPEGTYLSWLDCRGLGLDDKQLSTFFETKAKLWLSEGCAFGAAGNGFMRLNVATPKATIKEALRRITAAL
jgi:cystathionine beta-lyase